jgi:uncharacterized membrane protein YvlD (DUF360 family)
LIQLAVDAGRFLADWLRNDPVGQALFATVMTAAAFWLAAWFGIGPLEELVRNLGTFLTIVLLVRAIILAVIDTYVDAKARLRR